METGSTISATWAEKFFVHGCIAYLLYLQQALAADSSDKQDLQMSNAAAMRAISSWRMKICCTISHLHKQL